MELRFSIRRGEKSQDLAARVDADERVGALIRHLLTSLYGAEQGMLWSERRAAPLDPEARLGDSGILWGDTLRVLLDDETQLSSGTPARFEVTLFGGPMAGTSWPLSDGSYLVGREPGNDLQISDRSLSRTHARFDASQSGLTVTDLNSSNGVAVNGSRLVPGAPEMLALGDEVEMGRTRLKVSPVRGAAEKELLTSRAGRLEFNRRPRIRRESPAFHGALDAPPTRAAKARLPLAGSLVPLVGGAAMVLVTKQILFVAMVALSPMMAVFSYIESRRGGSRNFAKGVKRFRASLEAAATQLEQACARETEQRRASAPDLATLRELARGGGAELWERRRNDPDFLSIRVGLADLPASARVELGAGGDEQLRDEAQMRLEPLTVLDAVPVTLAFRELGMVGLAGSRAMSTRVATAMLIQACCLHSPADLLIAAAVDARIVQDFSWLKWLPHVDGDRLGLRQSIAGGTSEADDLLSDIRELVTDRKARSAGGDGAAPASLLVLLDEDVCTNRSLVTTALADAEACGVYVIWLGRDVRNLPGQTGAILEIEGDRAVGAVTRVEGGEVIEEISLDGLDAAAADDTARALAPLLDVSEGDRSGEIPNHVSLLELLEIDVPSAEVLMERWAGWEGRPEAVIGMDADGPVKLDLRSDGPHALIAGTTGSGKSELLRTIVAAAAAAAPPDRLTFLLFDYKGGAAFAPCRGLPHVLDVISDLDAHMAERALVSLEAELKRRERILAQSGAKDLLQLQRRSAADAPPMLIIAVDEFAKLREEVPEFVDGVVDIAQRGRSLGVHMILAAQTLSNAMTPAIRANTNLRIALRVSDEAESKDVLDSPVAAHVPSGERYRGRAFARTGHGELRELQTAYVSGLSAARGSEEPQIMALGLNGPVAVAVPKHAPENDDASDLTALAKAADVAREQLGLTPAIAPWLPQLPEVLDLRLLPAAPQTGGCAAIGLIDLPAEQRQDPLVIDLDAAGNAIVFGAAGSGKTTVMTTTALALAASRSPRELRVYAIEAGIGHLGALEQLPHCGGVIRVEDSERIERLLRALAGDIDAAAREATSDKPGRVTLLLIDDLGSFLGTHQSGTAGPQLERVIADGRKAGIHVIASGVQRQALPTRLAAHFGQRLALKMPTDDDLVGLGLDRKRVRGAKLGAGRGFTQTSDEFQIAVPCIDGRPLSLTDAVAAIRDAHLGKGMATRIGTLPQEVDRSALTRSATLQQVALGVADAGLATATVDLSEGHFLVAGPYRSGRSTALVTMALGAREAAPELDMFLLAPRRSRLRELEIWKATATTLETCTDAAEGLLNRVSADDPAPALVFIDDAGELSDAAVSTRLERVLKAGRERGLVVVAAAETNAARGITALWLRELGREGTGLLLQPDLLADGALLSVRLPRRLSVPLVQGRGFLVRRGQTELVQVAS